MSFFFYSFCSRVKKKKKKEHELPYLWRRVYTNVFIKMSAYERKKKKAYLLFPTHHHRFIFIVYSFPSRDTKEKFLFFFWGLRKTYKNVQRYFKFLFGKIARSILNFLKIPIFPKKGRNKKRKKTEREKHLLRNEKGRK